MSVLQIARLPDRWKQRILLAVYFAFVLWLSWFTLRFVGGFASATDYMIRRHGGGVPSAPALQWLSANRSALMLVPVPWLIFALVATARGRGTAREIVVFSSTLLCTLAAVTVAAATLYYTAWFRPPGWIEPGVLDAKQLADSRYLAEHDDAAACRRLYVHYAISSRDQEKARWYLARSEELRVRPGEKRVGKSAERSQ